MRSRTDIPRRLRRDCRGGTAIEYGLIVALIALSVLGAMKAMADQTQTVWNNVSEQVRTHA